MNFCAPLFRFFNSWIYRDGFDTIIQSAWENFNGGGPPDRILSDKLRAVKQAIKSWRRVQFEKESKELFDLKKKVDEIEIEQKAGPFPMMRSGSVEITSKKS